jgi:hypothetical protein
MTMTKVDFSSLARLADRFGNGELLSDTRLLYRLMYATPIPNYDVVNRFAF